MLHGEVHAYVTFPWLQFRQSKVVFCQPPPHGSEQSPRLISAQSPIVISLQSTSTN